MRFLKDIPLSEARACFDEGLFEAGYGGILGIEEIPLSEAALGRVIGEPVWASISSPHYHASAMDGFAIRAEDSIGAIPTKPVSLEVNHQAFLVDTGDPLPENVNCVVPVEQIEWLDENNQITTEARNAKIIRLRAALTPWQHVRSLGEDIVATQLVLPAGEVITPYDLGALAASGQTMLRVTRKPRVAILPTGSELVPLGTELKKGDIIEYNSIVLAAQIINWGGEPERYSITTDHFDMLCSRVQQAADTHDLVLVNAGSSAGTEDFTARVVEKLGDLYVHGVAIRPGHPVILGFIRRSDNRTKVPIIGVPGYPVSAAMTMEIFVAPLLERWLGKSPSMGVEVTAQLSRRITSPAGDDDYIRVVVGRVGKNLKAAVLARGAGVITSLTKADGIVVVPRGVQGYEAGEDVRVRLYREPAALEKTILAIGSHDMTLDLLAQDLAQHDRRLVSANVGSQGGMIAIRRGEAHLAGSHLFDPVSGEYNTSFIPKYLPEFPIRVMAWVYRSQGLMVKKGNPKKITTLVDLSRSDIQFINRQKGAGTRVLLDYQLSCLEIDKGQVNGYLNEEYTHLSVAAAVLSGRADCGLGIAAAARALDLDFIPLFEERYDLLIPLEFYENDLLLPLFRVMEDKTFRKKILALPGYDVRPMGNIII